MLCIAEIFIFLYVGMDALDKEKWRLSILGFRSRRNKFSAIL
jgi:hypothetical protein